VLQVCFFLWKWALKPNNEKILSVLQRHFVCNLENIRKKRYHTLLTAGFSHISPYHYFFNMLAFVTFGSDIEFHIGTAKLAALMSGGIISGSLAHIVSRKLGFSSNSIGSIGASGGLYSSIVK